jgi:hypothetical protein
MLALLFFMVLTLSIHILAAILRTYYRKIEILDLKICQSKRGSLAKNLLFLHRRKIIS